MCYTGVWFPLVVVRVQERRLDAFKLDYISHNAAYPDAFTDNRKYLEIVLFWFLI